MSGLRWTDTPGLIERTGTGERFLISARTLSPDAGPAEALAALALARMWSSEMQRRELIYGVMA